MTTPRLDFVTCVNPSGMHRMAYWEWGDPANDNVLLCVHGLNRTAQDFMLLAQALMSDYRIVCPDIVGRGYSDFHRKASYYTVPNYVADMMTLIARLNVKKINFLGTSMGGVIGLGLAGFLAKLSTGLQANKHLPPETGVVLNKIILNDVGPTLAPKSLARIKENLATKVVFNSLQEAVATMKTEAASFGPMSDEHWELFTKAGLKPEGDKWVTQYDVNIAEVFSAVDSPEEIAKSEHVLWSCYDAIECPILILHGETSDLLSVETVDEMLVRNANAQVVRIPFVGHAPTLLAEQQINLVKHFLAV